MSEKKKKGSEAEIREIKRKTRRKFTSEQSITHVRGKPLHPQTQGKIERYHRKMKNIIKLEHYYSPGELEAHIAEFVDYYNSQ